MNIVGQISRFLIAAFLASTLRPAALVAQARDSRPVKLAVDGGACQPMAQASAHLPCTADGHLRISSLADLKRLATATPNSKYRLCNDINVSALGDGTLGVLNRIILDGNGYTLRGLRQHNSSWMGSAGLFGALLDSTVKNLIIENPVIVTATDGGVLAQSAVNSVIRNVIVKNASLTRTEAGDGGLLFGRMSSSNVDGAVVSGEIIGNNGNAYFGGLVGVAYDSTIAHAEVTLTTITAASNYGGIAGMLNNSSIRDSRSTVDIREGARGWGPISVGGIAGVALCWDTQVDCINSIERAYSTGTIESYTGGNGGILGRNQLHEATSTTLVRDVHSTVNFSIWSHSAGGLGGIVGADGSNYVPYYKGFLSIENSLFTGTVAQGRQGVGGIIGSPSASTSIETSYFDKSKAPLLVDTAANAARSSAQLTKAANFVGWDLGKTTQSIDHNWVLPSQTSPILGRCIGTQESSVPVNY